MGGGFTSAARECTITGESSAITGEILPRGMVLN
jgi:hypothetical protein